MILLSINSFSQSTIKLITKNDSLIKSGVYINIYKNENSHVTTSVSNEDGFISLKIDKIDSTASYYFNFMRSSYNPIWHKLDLKNKDTLKVELSYDQYYTLENKDLYSGSYGYISFLNYYPRQPRRLNEIPKKIADSVTLYLRNRVGDSIYKDFKLIDGQIIDLEELNKKYSYWESSNTSYYLLFSYRNIDAGIRMYVSPIALDKDGNILKDIEFPKVEKNSVQLNLLSFEDIRRFAIDNSFFNEKTIYENDFAKEFKTDIELSYLADKNILVWTLTRTYNDGISFRNNFKQERRIYNAHNGEYIETKKGEIIIEE